MTGSVECGPGAADAFNSNGNSIRCRPGWGFQWKFWQFLKWPLMSVCLRMAASAVFGRFRCTLDLWYPIPSMRRRQPRATTGCCRMGDQVQCRHLCFDGPTAAQTRRQTSSKPAEECGLETHGPGGLPVVITSFWGTRDIRCTTSCLFHHIGLMTQRLTPNLTLTP